MDNVTQAEAEFMYYKNGTAGSFYTSLVNCFFKADHSNQTKLLSAFPELEPVLRYSVESGYWEDLQARWKNNR
jgi:hypothetical protein